MLSSPSSVGLSPTKKVRSPERPFGIRHRRDMKTMSILSDLPAALSSSQPTWSCTPRDCPFQLPQSDIVQESSHKDWRVSFLIQSWTSRSNCFRSRVLKVDGASSAKTNPQALGKRISSVFAGSRNSTHQ